MVTIYTLSDDMSLLVRIPLNQHVVRPRGETAHLQFWLLDMLGMWSLGRGLWQYGPVTPAAAAAAASTAQRRQQQKEQVQQQGWQVY